MNIDKAIEILSDEVKHPYSAKKMCRPDALKLGIEALKYVQQFRAVAPWVSEVILLGETKD